MNTVEKVLIISNRLNEPDVFPVFVEIKEYFDGRGVTYSIVDFRQESTLESIPGSDLALVLGGDGTVLFAAREVAPKGIPIMPVNFGEFGFITEISQTEWRATFERFEKGLQKVSERLMLTIEIVRDGKKVTELSGLNDAVVSAEGISKLVRLRVDLGETYLGYYRADGIIIATPVGSTAYSAAAGGPLLSPDLNAIIINPICPFTLSNRPIVVGDNREIIVTVEPVQTTELSLTVDGQVSIPLEPNDRVYCRQAPFKASFVRSDQRNFFEVIRTKLEWSGGYGD